jgi:hypothetical protein
MVHLAFDQAADFWSHPHGNRRYADVDMLLTFWGLARNTHYVSLPPSCDGALRYEERPGGRVIAIERQALAWPDIGDRRRFLCRKGRLEVLSVKDLRAFANAVTEAIQARLCSSRLLDVEADEHVWLLTSRLAGTDESTYLWAPFECSPTGGGHVYLVVEGRLLEFW